MTFREKPAPEYRIVTDSKIFRCQYREPLKCLFFPLTGRWKYSEWITEHHEHRYYEVVEYETLEEAQETIKRWIEDYKLKTFGWQSVVQYEAKFEKIPSPMEVVEPLRRRLTNEQRD